MVLEVSSALAIHSTSSNLGLSLYQSGQEMMTQTWDLGRDLSTQLHDVLFSFLHPVDVRSLSYIAVAIGPGGFTSTRIGVVTARTLAQQLDLPLFGISSLTAFAWQWAIAHHTTLEPRGKESPALAVEMPARRDQVSGAIYAIEPMAPPRPLQSFDPSGGSSIYDSWHMLPCSAVKTMDREAWQAELAKFVPGIPVAVADGPLGKTAAAVLQLADQEYQAGARPQWDSVHPYYGQSPV